MKKRERQGFKDNQYSSFGVKIMGVVASVK